MVYSPFINYVYYLLVFFCLLYLSNFTYLFISTEDPVNSKRILFTAGMVGDYSGLSTVYVYFYSVYIFL